MRRLISSVVLIAILATMLLMIPVQASTHLKSFDISESGVHVAGTVFASEMTSYKKISLYAQIRASEYDNCVSAIGVYISMWDEGHMDEAVTKVYVSPDPRDQVILGDLLDTGITPITPDDGYQFLNVYLYSEEDSDPDKGKITVVVHGEEWQAYCYVADIDFTGPEPSITPKPDEAETLAWRDWWEQIVNMPLTMSSLLGLMHEPWP
jgi:hypothetical protein